ncbi:MAG TPA: tRNA uridine(34) 5-carboxymethylaminomethyl modification radical SAM/GNAT enzyme Elp3 [Candidatus Nanoarchaeia archaeon]|nr:tRNA uridine(34) 5-carboxymethylaminomethyl modification radical SAM/GNAT enzyme Elp3 [Candidatus Nanoarchaeia archaeon]
MEVLDYSSLIASLCGKKLSKKQVQRVKNDFARAHRLERSPTDIQLLLRATPSQMRKLSCLQTKPVRSISGVSPVAIMTSPFPCPHGKCAMCPGGPGSEFGDVPQSYTGREPASLRAARADYDPYIQVMNRLEQYIVLGHSIDKIELIIMGGTFPSIDREYQDWFIASCFQAMNDFSRLFFKKYKYGKNAKRQFKDDDTDDKIDILRFRRFFELPGILGSKERTASIHAKLKKLRGEGRHSLESEQAKNERARVRCVGLTIETRPDWALKKHADIMLMQGCTRIELGVQSTDDSALKAVRRGHTVDDSIKATKILKDLGFKITYHMMLGLPGISQKKDLEVLKSLFTDEDFRPDMLKIYPCMVMKGTRLFDEWGKGRFRPITTEIAGEIISEFKRYCPEYVRIMRVQRDIPTYRIEAGVDRTNLRQYISELCRKKDITCRCIRCREIGRQQDDGNPKIRMQEYDASGGKEFFLSYETKNALYGFIRLRFPGQFLRPEMTPKSALVRELHVYGEAVALGEKGTKSATQHRGIGKLLLENAEEVAAARGKDKMVVISGVGAREYYLKRGYEREGVYMVKKL